MHARCSGYVQRRLDQTGFATRREVELTDHRWRGWVDLLAFDLRTGLLVIVEVKTSVDDLGAIDRRPSRYERLAAHATLPWGWVVRRVTSWLLLLASGDVDDAVLRQREVFDVAFPVRAVAMRRITMGHAELATDRGLALIDPGRRARTWLLPARVDGRRTLAPYRDRADPLDRLLGDRHRA